MKAYFRAFVNFKQNDWARVLPMAKFFYNNGKNSSTDYMLFELNCGYHPRVSFKKNTNPYFQLKLVNKLSAELQDLITVC